MPLAGPSSKATLIIVAVPPNIDFYDFTYLFSNSDFASDFKIIRIGHLIT